MLLRVFEDKTSLGSAAALLGGSLIRKALEARGHARIIAATGASQFEFLEALTGDRSIDWRNVEMFHLDEYVGLAIDHPASFRRFLLDRLIRKAGIERYHLLDGQAIPEEVCRDVGDALARSPVDVAFVGIGENGHLAFNDPPADFETEEPYIVVRLDEACRRQQVGEGWFRDISEVPERAISMSVRQILKAEAILCVVPDSRKAQAVKACFEGPIGPMLPASILRTHPNATVFLDRHSAALLKPELPTHA